MCPALRPASVASVPPDPIEPDHPSKTKYTDTRVPISTILGKRNRGDVLNRVPLIVVAVAISLLCIAGMGVIAMKDGGPETFRIEYVLNGGTNDPSNPVSYTSGDEFTLADASKDGMTFTGWYLDGDATDRFTAVTADTRGHLTLHAG